MAMSDYDLSDLALATGANRNNGMFANGDGLLWLLFILILGGGWGNRGFGGGFGGGGVPDGGMLYPWMNQAQSQWQGFTDVLQSLCSGFASVTGAITSGFASAESAAAARQMSDMQQMFGMQTAMMQGFNAQQSQLAQCCCENRLGIANLGADLAREACADRQAVSDGIRDVLAAQAAGTQRIIDKLCDQELFAERRDNDRLRQENSMLALQASQTAQTAQILQGQTAEVDALYNRLSNCPVPSMPVYGRQPIFTCQPQNGCGCGCAA